MPDSWSLDAKQCWVYIAFFLMASCRSSSGFAQQNSQTGEPLAKLGSGPLKQSQDPESDQSCQQQCPWGCHMEGTLPLQQTSFWQAQVPPGIFRRCLGLSPMFEAHWVQFRAHLCPTHCFCMWNYCCHCCLLTLLAPCWTWHNPASNINRRNWG